MSLCIFQVQTRNYKQNEVK